MICPKCHGIFKDLRHSQTKLIFSVCKSCSGIWLDKDKLWDIVKNKQLKKVFNKIGLVEPKDTKLTCPRCKQSTTFLNSGKIPLAEIEIEYCPTCEGMFFDKSECSLTTSKLDSLRDEVIKIAESQHSLEVQNSDFSIELFKHRLEELKNESYHVTALLLVPKKSNAIYAFFKRIGSAFILILKEPEILLFCLLQSLSVYIAYLIWIQMLDWIPQEVWDSARHSRGYSPASILLYLWTFICVGLAALPIGLFTASIGASHILNHQNKDSTIIRCLKYVFPKTWPIWIYSWIDGMITVEQILKRLPKRNDTTSLSEKLLSEAMYKAWKLGTMGIIPGLITSDNIWIACKRSFGFLKHKTLDVLLLRTGYSVINWVVAVLTYAASLFYFKDSNSLISKGHNAVFSGYFSIIFPLFIAIGFLHLFVRPIYVLSLFELYSDYLIETNQTINAPEKNKIAKFAYWLYYFLILIIVCIFLFRDQLGITYLLSRPFR